MIKILKKNKFILIWTFISILTLVLFVIYKSRLIEYPESTFRSILEIIYFVTSSSLLFVAAFGLKQLRIAKESSKMNAKRESYKLAAEQCTHYLNHIIPLIHEQDVLLNSIPIKTLGEVEIKINGNLVSFEVKLSKEIGILTDEATTKIVNVLNSIEAFSVFFTSRVAAEEVAFSSIGQTYCTRVKKLLPVIITASDGGAKGYSNIIKLYIAWNQKIEKQNALRDKMKAEQKLNQSISIDLKSLGT